MPTNITPRTTTVTLFQGDDFDLERALRREVEVAAVKADDPKRIGDSPAVMAAADAYDAFVAEAATRGVAVKLQALRRNDWRAMVRKHVAREDNDVDAAWGFNYETMCDDLVPASVILGEQFKSLAERDGFLDSLSDADFSSLYSEAVRLNQGAGPDPKVRVSSQLARTGDETSEAPTRLG